MSGFVLSARLDSLITSQVFSPNLGCKSCLLWLVVLISSKRWELKWLTIFFNSTFVNTVYIISYLIPTFRRLANQKLFKLGDGIHLVTKYYLCKWEIIYNFYPIYFAEKVFICLIMGCCPWPGVWEVLHNGLCTL